MKVKIRGIFTTRQAWGTYGDRLKGSQEISRNRITMRTIPAASRPLGGDRHTRLVLDGDRNQR
ncbi:hypothetical protein JJD41_20195 [Oxynema sp. CENA135]|uniref:hypothetical protein n=1 Tax=Oxynema sp. CENA135 TaxID=984206 RepID=UPI001A450D7B|nr:hypothetical protein [Oxynema sp. CENA135]MBK4732168.1 hypothetical protein [Oxynema sp. CENA135]